MNLLHISIVAAIGLVIGGFLAVNRTSADAPSRETTGWAMIDAGAVTIDARSAEEYASGHIDGAINIPHTQTLGRLSEFGADKSAPIVVYCRSGRRSGLAQDMLVSEGFTNVYNAGGYEGLITAKSTDTN